MRSGKHDGRASETYTENEVLKTSETITAKCTRQRANNNYYLLFFFSRAYTRVLVKIALRECVSGAFFFFMLKIQVPNDGYGYWTRVTLLQDKRSFIRAPYKPLSSTLMDIKRVRYAATECRVFYESEKKNAIFLLGSETTTDRLDLSQRFQRYDYEHHVLERHEQYTIF